MARLIYWSVGLGFSASTLAVVLGAPPEAMLFGTLVWLLGANLFSICRRVNQ